MFVIQCKDDKEILPLNNEMRKFERCRTVWAVNLFFHIQVYVCNIEIP